MRLRVCSRGDDDAVALALQRHGRHRDRRPCCGPPLDCFQRRVAGRIAEPVAIGMDDDVNEIRIVEGNGGALVGIGVRADGQVKLGLVASLARPGGNATAVNYCNQEVAAKWLGLLHKLVPKAVRVAVLINRANGPHGDRIARSAKCPPAPSQASVSLTAARYDRAHVSKFAQSSRRNWLILETEKGV